MAAGSDNRVLAPLRFKMIFASKMPSGALFDMVEYRWENRYGDSDQCRLQSRRAQPRAKLRSLSRRALLHRQPAARSRRIPVLAVPVSHPLMRAPNLHDVPKFFRLGFQGTMQFFQSRNQMVLQFLRGADVNRRGNHVVARLPHVDVIVGMNRSCDPIDFPDSCADLLAITSFALVSYSCPSRSENVERKMVVEFSFGDFFCRLCDRRRSPGVEQP